MKKLIYIILFVLLLPVFLAYLLLCLFSPLILIPRKIITGKDEKIYIVKDKIHSDYVFESKQISYLFNTEKRFLKVGWGDRKIFLETKSWSQLKLENFLKAFFGMNKSVLRLEHLEELPCNYKTIKLGRSQMDRLLMHIEQSYYGSPIKKLPEYYDKGEYYESDLNYNCFTNCNNWVNYGLFLIHATNKIWCPLSKFV